MPNATRRPNTPVTTGAKTRPTFTRTAMSVMLATALAVSANSYAQSPTEAAEAQYEIPAGPLGHTLSNFAANAGIALSFNPALTQDLSSQAISGQYSALEAMQQMLTGSGLILVQRADGSYTLNRSNEANNQAASSLPSITVTGEKFHRRLEDTLSSVAVVTEEDLRENGDQNLTEVLMRTPGVYSQSGNDNWGIRGVPASGFDNQGPVTLNSAVAVYVDGMLKPHRMVTINPLPLWDVRQIEIYRGPQSTVQGRNALAGAVIMHTNDPNYYPELAAQVNAGNYGQKGASLLVGGELVEDTVAGRFTLDYQDTDGYIDNVTLNKDAFTQRNFNARGKLLVQPSDDLDMLFTLSRSEYDRGENAVNAVNGNPQYFDVAYDTDAKSGIDENAVSAKIDYRINDDWTLISQTSASLSDYFSVLDFDQTAVANQEVQRNHDQDSYTQEFRLGYDAQNLRAHVGLYLNHIEMQTHDTLTSDPLTLLESRGDTEIDGQALFGELNWDMTEQWQLIAGLRYDHEENDTQIDYPTDLLSLAPAASNTVSSSFNALLPKLGLSYRPDDNQLIGFVVQRGYRAGGVHLRPTALHQVYDPEYTTNYELSYRGGWLDNRLRTSANLYFTDWEDQQVAVTDSNNFLNIVNAASSEMRGIELSAEFDLTDAVTLNADAALSDTEYKQFVSSAGDLSGQSFLYAPDHKLSLGITYRATEQLTTNLNATYQSDSPSAYLTDSNGRVTGTRRNDSVTLVNATLGYEINDNLSLNAYIKNLFDERYITTNQGDTLLDVGAPRMFGIALQARM